MSEPSPAELEAAIAEGLRFAGLEDHQRGYIVAYLHQDPAEWMNCCLSGCDPCVLRIGRAVKRTRERLGLPDFPRD